MPVLQIIGWPVNTHAHPRPAPVLVWGGAAFIFGVLMPSWVYVMTSYGSVVCCQMVRCISSCVYSMLRMVRVWGGGSGSVVVASFIDSFRSHSAR